MSLSQEKSTIENFTNLEDAGVFENLFKTHYPALCRVVFRIVKDKEQTEDIVQEVFLKIWNRRSELQINISIKSYLFRSSINTALNYVSGNKKLRSLEDQDLNFYSQNSVEENFDHSETESNIQKAIDNLPPACRTIFVLSRYEQMSYKEIAESLELSVKTVENQMSKALKILREVLKHYLILMVSFLLF